ncbi:MAG: DUF2878 domain-containing protein [Gammaproteobacteria bacterium HGW-Gammaproteobacteria-2]|jgi:hypothetical protein|nr:MAG: DUF2878 domain-containing protein [Gammaproteobacteria bacterium HGW-Gammaproteobacteria-2]
MNRTIANAVGFQIVWFASVAGAGHGMGWSGPLAALLFAAWVLGEKRTRSADLWLLVRALPIGYASDSLWVACGWMQFAEPWPGLPLAPIWILALWTGFVLSINHSLSFLHGRPWLAALLGAIFGPAAYYAAANGFNATRFELDLPVMLLLLAMVWAVLLPLILTMSARHQALQRMPTVAIPTGEEQ